MATQRTKPGAPLVGGLSEVGSIRLEVVQGKDQGRLWNEYVDRYHYLGYRQPMGCSLRYFIHSAAGLLGCVLDGWSGQSDPGRAINGSGGAANGVSRICLG